MRTPSLRLFVPLFLTIASLSIPASAHALPVSLSAPENVSAAGLYRLTFSAKDRRSKTVHMLVRETQDGMSALLLDRETESWLMNLRVEGTVLKGSIMTSEGLAELSLELGEGMVMGTLTVDGKLLTIDGDRNN